jgi:hypothetical protein
MAGEVKSQLTIKLEGGAAMASTPSSSSPVSRAAQLTWGPGQAMSDYAGDRQSRFAREVAKEISRDREAARELASIREKNRIRFEAEEVGSAVRAAEERMRRRDSLAQSVRANQMEAPDGFFTEAGARRGLKRGAVTASKRLMRGWGAGVAAGLGGSLAMPASDEVGAFGAFSRVTLSTISGAAWGGVPGAVGSFITSTLSEVMRSLTEKDKEIENVRKEIAESRREAKRFLEESDRRLREALERLKEKFDEDVRSIIVKSQDLRRREEQFESVNLLGN